MATSNTEVSLTLINARDALQEIVQITIENQQRYTSCAQTQKSESSPTVTEPAAVKYGA
jgi:hypothetical protein